MKHGNIRVLCALVSVVMLLSVLSVLCLPASALTVDETGTAIVYVKDGGTGDGTTAETPVGTIDDAVAAINTTKTATKGKIVLVGDVTVTAGKWLTGHSNKEITYVSAEEIRYTMTFLNTGNSTQHCFFQGPTVFTNLKIQAVGKEVILNATGNAMTVGLSPDDVTVISSGQSVTVNDTEYQTANVSLAPTYTTKAGKGTKVILNSGSFATVYSALPANGGTITGNAYVEINESVSVKYLEIGTVGVKSTVTGRTDIHINGASIDNIRTANASSAKALATFSGAVTVNIRSLAKMPNLVQVKCNYFDRDNKPEAASAGVWFADGLYFDFSGYQGAETDYATLMRKLGYVTVATSGSVNFCGTQTSYKTGDELYSVRFVAGLRNLDYQAVGFEIVAKDADGNTLHTYRKDTTSVYNTILASDESGVTEEITADDIGGNYIIALTISKIPVSQGKVIFDVTPYTIADGVETKGVTKTVAYDSGNYSN